jgi:hypothetical protein
MTDDLRAANPDSVRRITAFLWGHDIVDIRAAVESFGNGWTVVPKNRVAELEEALAWLCDFIEPLYPEEQSLHDLVDEARAALRKDTP